MQGQVANDSCQTTRYDRKCLKVHYVFVVTSFFWVKLNVSYVPTLIWLWIEHTGIDELTVNTEKGILTVIGTVDPVCLATQIRKAKKFVDIISVGPNKKPEEKKPDAKKPDENKKPDAKPPVCEPLPPCCKQCQLVAVSYAIYDHDPPNCYIL